MEKDLFVQLKEKMTAQINEEHPYEALQLAESFVARKKKVVGRDVTSALVFHGAKILIAGKASNDAGSLLSWFIEDGAGDDYYFKLEADNDSSSYCDVSRLQELLKDLSPSSAYPVVEKIYGPIHKLMVKKNISSNSRIGQKLYELELSWINTFEATKTWPSAYKAVVRLGDMERAAGILNSWAQEGYQSEYPLFFARAILNLLADGHLTRAVELLNQSKQFVVDDPDTKPNDPQAACLAVWHFTIILIGLAKMEPKQRVDKQKIFSTLTEKYSSVILKTDRKLTLLFEKIGKNIFGIAAAGDDQGNPMAAMFQSMLAGGGGKKDGKTKKSKKAVGGPPSPSLDINAMMSLLSNMQANGN